MKEYLNNTIKKKRKRKGNLSHTHTCIKLPLPPL